MSWTDDRITLLKGLWEKGLSASQIAAELGEGITRNAVIGKAHRLGLKSRPSPLKATPPAKPAAAPKVAKEKKVEEEKKITILSLTERICKWPIGHPGEPDFHFCGKKSQPGQPYCPKHAAMAYQSPQSKRERARANTNRSRG